MISVAHGQIRLPTAQRIIASSVQLNASPEAIGRCLRTTECDYDMEPEANALLELYRRLYPIDTEGSSLLAALDSSDKTAIFSGRLKKLVTSAASKQFYSVSTISDADDKKVYKLIQESINQSRRG